MSVCMIIVLPLPRYVWVLYPWDYPVLFYTVPVVIRRKLASSIICGSPHHFKKKLARQMVIWLLVKLYKSKVHFKSNHLIRYNTVHQSLLVLTFCLCSLTSNLKPLYLHACTYSCSKIPIETQLGFVHHTQGLGRIKLTRYGDLRYSSPVQAEGKILERKLKSFPRLVI